MKRLTVLWIITALLLLAGYPCYAQDEEESAELFLEEYTDEFQEHFFEALKQKSIQNYDRAINLLLSCKQLDPQSDVVDYQLAKTYFLDKQYIQAQEYAIEALHARPSDFWYLESLVNIMEQQGRPMETIKARVPLDKVELKENLALIYFKKTKYNKALQILESMGDSQFATELGLKIRDSLQQNKAKSTISNQPKQSPKEDDPVAQYRSRMEGFLEKLDYNALEKMSEEALEAYPLQAYFHYAYGAALNGKSETARAIEVLEGARDYLFDDNVLANKIYRELAKAYTTIGNPTKATEYLNKVKPGL
ncbi:tetratricopeptide repeat protein [Flagellimonas myxillae]|uniref:tetratricopeptide repeat protein n=1 Tax=Flagellimonas myxillae TaxID=2942214 RepID=UPI00201EA21F|nr:hypothetical protein [Muricauda myxillae]MCL6266719.1 hypothetical protein [Muricauda myxillae]